jgi:hypothetical protein
MTRSSVTFRLALAAGIVTFAGIAASVLLLVRLQITTSDYDAILGQRELQHQDRARVIQLTLKREQQAWQNLLLRGRDPLEFTRYEWSLRAETAAVTTQAEALLREETDPEARMLLSSFVDAHATMRLGYAEAIAVLSRTGHDVTAADALVQGQDGPATDLLDALAARTRRIAQARQAATSSAAHRSIRFSLLAVLAVFAVALVVVVRMLRSVRAELAARGHRTKGHTWGEAGLEVAHGNAAQPAV